MKRDLDIPNKRSTLVSRRVWLTGHGRVHVSIVANKLVRRAFSGAFAQGLKYIMARNALCS